MTATLTVPNGLKKAAVLCILRSADGLLLLRRTKEPHLGTFIPIGGKLEPFETPDNAALREIDEETGLRVEAVRLQGILTETSPTGFNWINYVYAADVPVVELPTCEEGVLEWVPDNVLTTIPTPETDLHIYSRVSHNTFFIFNAVYDSNLNLVCLRDDLSGQPIVDRSLLRR